MFAFITPSDPAKNKRKYKGLMRKQNYYLHCNIIHLSVFPKPVHLL